MKLLDSEVKCPSCGELMSCLLTGPPSQPHTRATYVCRNNDHLGVCQGAGWLARHPLGEAPPGGER